MLERVEQGRPAVDDRPLLGLALNPIGQGRTLENRTQAAVA